MQYKYSVLEYLRPYLEHESVLKMKAYVQHGDVSTYRHCLNVACYSLYLARKWRWMVDEESLVVGAFLHDFYLYDWHIRKRKRTASRGLPYRAGREKCEGDLWRQR